MSKRKQNPITLLDFIPETDTEGFCSLSCPLFVNGNYAYANEKLPNGCKRGLGRIVDKKWVKPGPRCPRYPAREGRPMLMMPKIKPNPVVCEPVKKGDKHSRKPDVNLGMIERFMGGMGASIVSTIITNQLEKRVSALERLHKKALKRLRAGDKKVMRKFAKGSRK